MSVQDKFFFDGGQEDLHPKQGIEGAAGNPQVIGGQHSFAGKVQQAKSAAGSGWNKGGRGNPPLFQGYVPSHFFVATHATAATSVVATSGYFVGTTCWSVAEIMPAGSFAPRVPMESLAPITIHITKRQLRRLFHMSLPVLSTFMPRMQKENLPTSMLASSPNMPVILQRSRILNIIWTHGICQIPLSFLRSSTLMLYQWKIAGQKGS
jgi:hypothetical protein